MALFKEIELESGVTVRYHRIVSVNTITNVHNVIEIASYTSQQKREAERVAVTDGEPMDIFVSTRYENAPYDQTMTVEGAYGWVKALPEFEGAEDC